MRGALRARLAPAALLAALALLAPGPGAAAGTPGRDRDGGSFADRLRRRDPAAIESLEKRFESAPTQLEKQRLAVILAALGRGDRYFEYLAGLADRAVADETPFPLAIDEHGAVVARTYSAEFLAWAARHGRDPDQAARAAVYDAPGDVLLLGKSRDPRAVAILLRGLDSANWMVVYQAGRELALLGAGSAAEKLRRRAETAPAEVAKLLARALVLFPDPDARRAGERLLADPDLIAALRREAEAEKLRAEEDLRLPPR